MENPPNMDVFMGKSSLNGPFSMANVKLPEGIILSQTGSWRCVICEVRSKHELQINISHISIPSLSRSLLNSSDL